MTNKGKIHLKLRTIVFPSHTLQVNLQFNKRLVTLHIFVMGSGLAGGRVTFHARRLVLVMLLSPVSMAMSESKGV